MPEPEEEWAKREVANGGDHPWVDTRHDDKEIHDKAYLAKTVYEVEINAIKNRRQYITTRNRHSCEYTGLALSGGGIRSASFGLGALQAFHQHSGIEGIDYLSTVSGGGYIGCSLTAALDQKKGEFPFAEKDGSKAYADTDSVRHIRDFSNYLIPHGAADIASALGIIARGLVANVLIILPVLLFCVLFTLFYIFVGDLLISILGRVRVIDPLWGLHRFSLTVIVLMFNLVFLIVWAILAPDWRKSALHDRPKSDWPDDQFRGGWVGFSRKLFRVTMAVAFFEFQLFVLWEITSQDVVGTIQSSSTKFLSLTTILAAMSTIPAFFPNILAMS